MQIDDIEKFISEQVIAHFVKLLSKSDSHVVIGNCASVIGNLCSKEQFVKLVVKHNGIVELVNVIKQTETSAMQESAQKNAAVALARLSQFGTYIRVVYIC